MSKAEAEQVYTSREVATLLGLGGAMLRRYAVCYERVTGVQLPLDRRDGRTFAKRDVVVLSQARQLVATQGLPVDKALEMVLAQPESAPRSLVGVSTVNGEALAVVLAQAITEAQRPLLGELQAMRVELEALRSEMRDRGPAAPTRPVVFGAEEWATEPLEPPPSPPRPREQHGPLVRLALWLEHSFKKIGSQ